MGMEYGCEGKRRDAADGSVHTAPTETITEAQPLLSLCLRACDLSSPSRAFPLNLSPTPCTLLTKSITTTPCLCLSARMWSSTDRHRPCPSLGRTMTPYLPPAPDEETRSPLPLIPLWDAALTRERSLALVVARTPPPVAKVSFEEWQARVKIGSKRRSRSRLAHIVGAVVACRSKRIPRAASAFSPSPSHMHITGMRVVRRLLEDPPFIAPLAPSIDRGRYEHLARVPPTAYLAWLAAALPRMTARPDALGRVDEAGYDGEALGAGTTTPAPAGPRRSAPLAPVDVIIIEGARIDDCAIRAVHSVACFVSPPSSRLSTPPPLRSPTVPSPPTYAFTEAAYKAHMCARSAPRCSLCSMSGAARRGRVVAGKGMAIGGIAVGGRGWHARPAMHTAKMTAREVVRLIREEDGVWFEGMDCNETGKWKRSRATSGQGETTVGDYEDDDQRYLTRAVHANAGYETEPASDGRLRDDEADDSFGAGASPLRLLRPFLYVPETIAHLPQYAGLEALMRGANEGLPFAGARVDDFAIRPRRLRCRTPPTHSLSLPPLPPLRHQHALRLLIIPCRLHAPSSKRRTTRAHAPGPHRASPHVPERPPARGGGVRIGCGGCGRGDIPKTLSKMTLVEDVVQLREEGV
ncbi:hypothetical protein B0H12DRAFT_1229015 [Mycena haematopus]|nr:hypothetical protein B0H12DRAFT_1229015 [Mycena haematopus]